MPYTPDTWANNDPTKPLNATRLTKLAGQYPQVMADLPAKIADSGDPIGAALNSTYGAVTLVTAHGAVGDGVTNDSAAFVAALAAVPDYGTVWLPEGTYVLTTPVSLTRTKVSIGGPGRIQGKLIVGEFGANYDFQGQSITGIKFTRGGASTDATVACLELRNVLNLTIQQCSFRDAGSAIYCYTEFDTARNTIQGNLYHNVGYFLRSVTGPTPSGRSASLQWRSIADIHVINNTGQANVTGIHCDSIDGIVIAGNTMFMPGYSNASTIKEHNIKLGYSDWTVITGNNLFEAGLDAINLTDPNHFMIADNNVAWPGQRVPSDAYSLTFNAPTTGRGFAQGFIGIGMVSQVTKNVVGLYGTGTIDLSYIVVGEGSIERDISSAPAQYYGAAALPTPYRVFMASTINSKMPMLPPAPNHSFGLNIPDNHRGRFISQERWLSGTIKEQTLFNRTVTINAGDPVKNIYEIRTADGGSNPLHFAGTLQLWFTTATGGTTKTAWYMLNIGKTPNNVVTCSVIASSGNTTGAAADDPSFTFDILNSSGTYYLRITRVGSTALVFNYTGKGEGTFQLQ